MGKNRRVVMLLAVFLMMPAFVPGAMAAAGNAAQFNSGSNSYISVPSSAALKIQNALTLEAWMRPTGSGGKEWALVMGKQLNPADANPWYLP